MYSKALAPRLGLDLGDYRGLPDDRTATADLLHPLHYASLRGDDVVLAPPPRLILATSPGRPTCAT